MTAVAEVGPQDATSGESRGIAGGRLAAPAAAVGVTEGQLWTLLVGLVTAATLALGSTLGTPMQAVSAPVAGSLLPAPAVPLPGAPAELLAPPPPAVVPEGPVLPAEQAPLVPELTDPQLPGVSPAAPPPPVPGATPAPLPAPPSGGAPVPAKTAWFSADAATDGVALAPEVREDALPVARRAGTDYRVSALTLTGPAAGVLVLREAEGTAAQQLNETARVDLCPLLEDFEPGPAQPLAAAPTADCRKPVKGVRDDSGVWTFDLASLPKTPTSKGFLLVPGVDAPPAFQVAYSAATDPAQEAGAARSSGGGTTA
jgi:hypothetical protein